MTDLASATGSVTPSMRRLVLVVSAVVFADTTFYAVVAPLLPHYVDDLHLSKASAGILLAAYPGGMLLSALPAGLLAGRIGPRRTVLLGLMLMGLASVGFAFAHDIVLLDVSRLIQGVGGACSWAGGLAWLTATAPPERRGALIGSALGTSIAGALLGPVLGGAAVAVGTEPVFGAVAAVAGLLALAAAAIADDCRCAVPEASLLRTMRERRVRVGMWLVCLPGLGFGLLDVLVPLQLNDLDVSQTGIAGVFLIAAAVEAAVSPLAGRTADRRGALVPIRSGLLAAVALTLGLPASAAVAVVAVLLIADKAAFGTFWAPAMALLSDAAERVGADQGLAFGLVNFAWALGMVVGAAGGGALADHTTDTVPFLLLACLCASTLIAVRRPSLRMRDGERANEGAQGG